MQSAHAVLFHFGLHFGVILGAKFATILFFGRRSREQDAQTVTFLAMRFSWILSASATSRRGVGGEGGALWEPGNIAFGPLEDDITMCFCTFCTEASAKP